MSKSSPSLLLPLFSTLTFILCLLANYAAGSGWWSEYSIGQVSALYETAITPADYAFAIWGLIYLALLAFLGFQWYCWRKGDPWQTVRQSALWFSLANICNAAWTLAWVQLALGWSVVFMLGLLFCLIMLVIRLRLEIYDAPLRIIALVWWPVCFYIAWICLALITNVAAWLVSLSWDGAPLSPPQWTVIIIIAATAIYLFLILKRNMREVSLVAVWGFAAIALKQSEHSGIWWAVWICSGILLLVTAWHGYKNRDTNPMMKWQRGEI